ncbi:SRPBCC family protein [Actinotalea solisilvae]|uniref:SRPBCC family protein n=1 Tax=Actinotalea solisilvae TaxID=2072922 RepID=UPI0018F22E72|nr:SRPBCC family protein [Actinotalea solisilvae]
MTLREVTVSRVVAAPADVVWGVVTDVRNHARWIPLTRVDVEPGPPDAAPASRIGERFVGVTGPTATRGGRGMADAMVVERFDPPVPARGREPAREGVAVYRKQGPVLLGDAEVRVRPLGPRHCTVTWVERVHVRGLPRPVGSALVAATMAGMLRLVLHRVATEVAGDHPAVADTTAP